MLPALAAHLLHALPQQTAEPEIFSTPLASLATDRDPRG